MSESFWWLAEKGEVHSKLIEHISAVESNQSDLFERFLKLACLYDPYETMGQRGAITSWPKQDSVVSENVVASNIDTVTAIIASHKPRARFMTDDGDWSTQRTAKRLEWYAEGLAKKLEVHLKAQQGFTDGAKFGTGLAKVYEDGKRVCVERVLVDEIIVDEGECRSGPPRRLAQRRFVDRDVLKSKFPDHAEAIDKAHTTAGSGLGSWVWADYRQLERNQVVVVEAWMLPIGEQGDDGYQAGRHVLTVEGADLADEKYHKQFFPFARFVWSDRTCGWYGIGLAERIAGHQRQLNKLNYQIDSQLDLIAKPTTYVRLADAGLTAKITNVGGVTPYKTDLPKTVIPNAVGSEVFNRHATIKASSSEESGVSSLARNATKPAGLESAVALREYKDSTTERFAIQEQRHEQFFLDIIWLMLDAAKDLGKHAPVITRKSRYGTQKLKWSDVDMGEVRVQMEAANSLSRTPAGRTQTVIEWAQAGVISQDEARRLMQHPDLERAMSLYNAAIEDIERCIEEILDGELLVPEPYQNLKLGVWRFQAAYLKAQADGAPEEVLESLRTWIVQAAHTLAPPQPMAAPMPMADPMAPQAAPQAALAPQAMALAPA